MFIPIWAHIAAFSSDPSPQSFTWLHLNDKGMQRDVVGHLSLASSSPFGQLAWPSHNCAFVTHLYDVELAKHWQLDQPGGHTRWRQSKKIRRIYRFVIHEKSLSSKKIRVLFKREFTIINYVHITFALLKRLFQLKLYSLLLNILSYRLYSEISPWDYF